MHSQTNHRPPHSSELWRHALYTCAHITPAMTSPTSHIVVYWWVNMADTHPYPPLISRGQTLINLWVRLFLALSEEFPLHTQIAVYLRFGWLWQTHILTPIPTLDCFHKRTSLRGAFLFHAYRGVSLTRMQRYVQIAYLFHQCGASLLSRDGRTADCTVKHPGVELSFSSYHCEINAWWSRNHSRVVTYIYIQIAVYWRGKMTDAPTYTHPCPRLISRVQTHIHFGARLFQVLSGAVPLRTHTSSGLLEIWLAMTETHAHTYIHTHYPRLITCTSSHTPRCAFLFYT